MKRFKKNLSLDAQMVFTAAHHGMSGLIQFGYMNRHIFNTTDDVTDRAEWLKKQDDAYLKEVSDKVVELEKQSLI